MRLGVQVKVDVLLCVDGDVAVSLMRKSAAVEFETIIASKGEHVHEKIVHWEKVNVTLRRFKNWFKRFNGIGSK